MLPRWWPVIGFARLHHDAGKMAGSFADILENRVCRATLLPVLELHLDGADHILRYILLALRRAARTGVKCFKIIKFQDFVFNLTNQRILLVSRHVAARMNIDKCHFRFDLREELDAVAMSCIIVLNTNEGEDAEHDNLHRMAQTDGQKPDIMAGKATDGPDITGLRRGERSKRL